MSEMEQVVEPPSYGDAKAQEAARVEQETNAPTTTAVVEEAAQPQVQTTTNVTIVQNQQVFLVTI